MKFISLRQHVSYQANITQKKLLLKKKCKRRHFMDSRLITPASPTNLKTILLICIQKEIVTVVLIGN